jgi:hypothetical protein
MMASTGMVGWSSSSTVSMVAFLLSVDSTPVAPDETALQGKRFRAASVWCGHEWTFDAGH